MDSLTANLGLLAHFTQSTSPCVSAPATSQLDSLLADGSSDTTVGAVLGGRGRQLLMSGRGGVDFALLDGAENLADSWQKRCVYILVSGTRQSLR